MNLTTRFDHHPLKHRGFHKCRSGPRDVAEVHVEPFGAVALLLVANALAHRLLLGAFAQHEDRRLAEISSQ